MKRITIQFNATGPETFDVYSIDANKPYGITLHKEKGAGPWRYFSYNSFTRYIVEDVPEPPKEPVHNFPSIGMNG